MLVRYIQIQTMYMYLLSMRNSANRGLTTAVTTSTPQKQVLVNPKDPRWGSLKLKCINSRTAFSWQVFQVLFAKEEMVGRNCHGARGKQPLDADKLLQIKRIAFHHHPMAHHENEHVAVCM
jgi:hypothetical protein